MHTRLIAALVLGALAPASAAVVPAPSPTPLKEIAHVKSSMFCSALKRNIGPAIGAVLQNDRMIAASKPLFANYYTASATATKDFRAGKDLDVARMESLITPMVANVSSIERLLDQPGAFPAVARTAEDRKMLAMRDQLRSVLAQQKNALNLISGFVDTQQLGELQQEGTRYNAALTTADVRAGNSANPSPANPNSPTNTSNSSTSGDAGLLNAGLSDSTKKGDPRFKDNGMLVGANPLTPFVQAVGIFQERIGVTERKTAKTILASVSLCGGHTPEAPSPGPSATP